VLPFKGEPARQPLLLNIGALKQKLERLPRELRSRLRHRLLAHWNEIFVDLARQIAEVVLGGDIIAAPISIRRHPEQKADCMLQGEQIVSREIVGIFSVEEQFSLVVTNQ
jgi:hypothetical protein